MSACGALQQTTPSCCCSSRPLRPRSSREREREGGNKNPVQTLAYFLTFVCFALVSSGAVAPRVVVQRACSAQEARPLRACHCPCCVIVAAAREGEGRGGEEGRGELSRSHTLHTRGGVAWLQQLLRQALNLSRPQGCRLALCHCPSCPCHSLFWQRGGEEGAACRGWREEGA